MWWPDTAVEYVGLVTYALLAGLFVYWLSGVNTDAFFARLFREPPSPPIPTYVDWRREAKEAKARRVVGS